MEPSASTDTITKSCHMDIAAREAGKCHVRRKEGTLYSPQSATEGGWWGFGLPAVCVTSALLKEYR